MWYKDDKNLEKMMVSAKLSKLIDRIAVAVHAARDPKAQRNGHARLGKPPGTYIVYKILEDAPYTNTYKEYAAEMGSSITEKLTVAFRYRTMFTVGDAVAGLGFLIVMRVKGPGIIKTKQ